MIRWNSIILLRSNERAKDMKRNIAGKTALLNTSSVQCAYTEWYRQRPADRATCAASGPWHALAGWIGPDTHHQRPRLCPRGCCILRVAYDRGGRSGQSYACEGGGVAGWWTPTNLTPDCLRWNVSRGVRGNEDVCIGDERDKATTAVSGKYSLSCDDNVGLEDYARAEQPELRGDGAGERVSALGVERFGQPVRTRGSGPLGEAINLAILSHRNESVPGCLAVDFLGVVVEETDVECACAR